MSKLYITHTLEYSGYECDGHNMPSTPFSDLQSYYSKLEKDIKKQLYNKLDHYEAGSWLDMDVNMDHELEEWDYDISVIEIVNNRFKFSTMPNPVIEKYRVCNTYLDISNILKEE